MFSNGLAGEAGFWVSSTGVGDQGNAELKSRSSARPNVRASLMGRAL